MAVAALAGCGAFVPRVTPELVAVAQARDPSLDAGTLERGREIFVTKCASCHGLPDPLDYSDAEWPRWMQKMTRKAKLTEGQPATALSYVLTARAAEPR
jgi:mono/diheme cytochrome c family protein